MNRKQQRLIENDVQCVHQKEIDVPFWQKQTLKWNKATSSQWRKRKKSHYWNCWMEICMLLEFQEMQCITTCVCVYIRKKCNSRDRHIGVLALDHSSTYNQMAVPIPIDFIIILPNFIWTLCEWLNCLYRIAIDWNWEVIARDNVYAICI